MVLELLKLDIVDERFLVSVGEEGGKDCWRAIASALVFSEASCPSNPLVSSTPSVPSGASLSEGRNVIGSSPAVA